MATNRFLDQLNQRDDSTFAPAGLSVAGFMVCPLALCPGFAGPQAAWQQQLYQVAFEQARAAAHRPTRLERDLFGVWN
jgi:hypothetical protein